MRSVTAIIVTMKKYGKFLLIKVIDGCRDVSRADWKRSFLNGLIRKIKAIRKNKLGPMPNDSGI